MEVITEKEEESFKQENPQASKQPDSGSDKPSPTKRAVAIVVTLAIALAAVALLSKWRSAAKSEAKAAVSSGETAVSDPDLVGIDQSQEQSIKVEAVKMLGFTAEKSATGKIAFNEDYVTPVFSPFTGRVVTLLAKPGDVVRKGSPLFEIDTPDLGQAESDLLTAVSGVTKAKASMELAERTEDRQHRLYLNKAVALKDWEQAQTDVTTAQSDLRSAEASEGAARDKLKVFGKTDYEINGVETTRRIDRITKVFSPIAGSIVTRKVGPGQYVKPDNPDPLFTLANMSTMWMLADVYEADAPLVKVGESVRVRVMAFPNETFNASISYISPTVDATTRRIAVRCVVENRQGKLKPDMFASFQIQTSGRVEALAVPASAVVRDGEHTTVWVAAGGNKFARKTVTTGLQQDGYVQVVSGLNDGDRIVSEGSLLLSNLASS
ncbi:MAG: efflux RND transporter periplasmic adaptor subunit [Blastocatellia bacterium]